MPQKIIGDNVSVSLLWLFYQHHPGVYCFHYEPSNCREKTVERGKVKRLNADQINSDVEIKGLSNLIMQTDTNTHEREPTGGERQLIIIHMKYPQMSDK